MVIFNYGTNKVLENCKIKKISKKMYSCTWTLNNKIKETKLYKSVGKIGNIVLVVEFDLRGEINGRL